MLPKFLRFKGLLLSDDSGKTWIVVRQHYLTDEKNNFLDTIMQGRRLKLIEESTNEKVQATEG
jgi:hypothetical protein